MGKAHKYADKWGKEGVNVWHERWGEDYDGVGGCTKWTDKVFPSGLPRLACCFGAYVFLPPSPLGADSAPARAVGGAAAGGRRQ